MSETAIQPEWFPNRLREIRARVGFRREQLARLSGMSTRAIINIEQGLSHPKWDTVCALCNAMGVSANEFQVPPTTMERATTDHRIKKMRPLPESASDRIKAIYNRRVSGATLNELAEEFSVSKGRICQILQPYYIEEEDEEEES